MFALLQIEIPEELRDEPYRVCMDIPPEGYQPVFKVFITFEGENITVSQIRIIKCFPVESELQNSLLSNPFCT